MNDIRSTIGSDVGERPAGRGWIPSKRQALIGLAVAAVSSGAALNWSWLVAVGLAPLILSVLPCVVMLIYLDQALNAATAKRQAAGEQVTIPDLYGAVMQGALYRVRPLMMTVVAIMAGLLPIMWGTGTGSEVMRRIAAPMVGGMISATILTLIIISAIYALVKEFTIRKRGTASAVAI